MRVTEEESRKIQEQIVDTAAELFMQKGFDSVSVAELMKASGLTHGGFYNRFKSKTDLAAQTVPQAFRRRPSSMSRPRSLAAFIKSYVSALHVDRPDAGCPVAALGGDAARESDRIKQGFEAGMEEMIATIGDLLLSEGKADSEANARRQSMNLIAKMVGAIVMARALPSHSDLREELLTVLRRGVEQDSGDSPG